MVCSFKGRQLSVNIHTIFLKVVSLPITQSLKKSFLLHSRESVFEENKSDMQSMVSIRFYGGDFGGIIGSLWGGGGYIKKSIK